MMFFKRTVGFTTMPFRYCHSKAVPKHTQLISRRSLSYFSEELKIHNQMKWREIQSFLLLRRLIECKRFQPLIITKRCAVSGKRAKRNALENQDEIDKPKKERLIKKPLTNTVIEDDEESMIHLNDKTSITQEDIELFREISEGDTKVFDYLKYLSTKVDMLSKMYGVSLKMNKDKWIELLNCSKTMRIRYLTYLITVAIRNQVKEKPKLVSYEDQIVDQDFSVLDDPMCYHLFHNSMFLKFRTQSFKKRLYSKSMASILHSPEIFIDCSYDKYMNNMESKYLGRQIIDCIRQNLITSQPYNLILCNFDKENALGKSMTKYSPLFYEDYYPIVMTPKSYLDLCPRENLVYLTPHCNNIMKEIDPNKKYIIGGYVDKCKSQQISLAKAKENKIAMTKFPLDKYLDWQKGKKSLCVNHVFSIMLSLKNNKNDWHKAFDVIPRRFMMKQSVKERSKSNIYSNVKHIMSLDSRTSEENFVLSNIDLKDFF